MDKGNVRVGFMGYEIMLVVPVMVFFIRFFIKNTERVWLKFVHFGLGILALYLFCFVYPSPLGYVPYKPYVYWKGGNKKGELSYKYKNFKKRMLRKIGIELVEK